MAAPSISWLGTRLRPLRSPGTAPALGATSVHEPPTASAPETAGEGDRSPRGGKADEADAAAARAAVDAASEALLGGEKPPDELVFSGGGVRGWAYVGLLAGLEEARCDILKRAKTFVGSSVGAAFAFACALGVGADEARAVFKSAIDALGEPSLAGLAVGRGGMVDTSGIEAAMRGILRRAVGRDSMTFRQLLDARGVTLGVTYVDVVTKRTALCGPHSSPHEDIVTCAIDSMRIFPVIGARTDHATFTCRVDGGFGNNLPMAYCRPARSLGFLLCGATSLNEDAAPRTLDSIGVATVFSRIAALVLETVPETAVDPASRGRVIRIDTQSVSAMALDCSDEDVERLIRVGSYTARALADALAKRAPSE